MIGSTAPIPVFDPNSWTRITTGTVQDLSTNSKVVVTSGVATSCIRGMVIKFTSGTCVNDFSTILAIQDPILQLGSSLVAAPAAGDSFEVYGHQFMPDWTVADSTAGGSRLLRMGAKEIGVPGTTWRSLRCDSIGRLTISNTSFTDFIIPNLSQGVGPTSMSAVGNTVELPSNPDDSSTNLLLSGTHSGVSVAFEINSDGTGAIWEPYYIERISDGEVVASDSFLADTSKQYRFNSGQVAAKVRARLTAITSGSISAFFSSYSGVKTYNVAASQRGTWNTVADLATIGGEALISDSSSTPTPCYGLPAFYQNDSAKVHMARIDDANNLYVHQLEPSTATTKSVATSTTQAKILNAGSGLLGRSIYNNSASGMYVKYETGVTSTSFRFVIKSGELYEFPWPIYQGDVWAILASGTGTALCGEEY